MTSKLKAPLYMKPYFSPDRLVEDLLVGFVQRTHKTLDIAIFSFTLPSLRDAIYDAVKRGVRVRIAADGEQSKQPSSLVKAMQVYVSTLTTIPKGTLEVKIESKSGKLHSKYMISDSKAVMFGSVNFSRSGVYANSENLIVIRHKAVVSSYEENFSKLWDSRFKFPRVSALKASLRG